MGTSEEVAVAEVISEQTLRLAAAPSHQGSVSVQVRTSGTYLVIGSESGVQKNRVVEGTSYTSETGAISLTIRPSRSNPTTEDDYFTFLTTDGENPINNGVQRWPCSIAVVTRPGDTRLTAYMANRNTDAISVIDLGQTNPQLRKTIQ